MKPIWLLLLCFGCGCSSASLKAVRDRRPGPFIAVMAAYPPEIEANESVLTEGGTRVATWRIDGIVFQQVRFEGHRPEERRRDRSGTLGPVHLGSTGT